MFGAANPSGAGGNMVKRLPMKPAQIEEIFHRFAAHNPDPRGELQFINPYTLLVAVVLSAQATDASVNKATEPLFRIVQTPAQMVALGEERLRDYIRTIGLFNTKAKNVIRLSEILVANHGGMVPPQREVLETLPGVGRKTANVVLNIAFGEPTIAVDTHIFRVGNRTGLAPGKTPREVEDRLEKVVPSAYKLHAHHWLILHGRYVCKALKPDCPRCLIQDLCQFKGKLLVADSNAPGLSKPLPKNRKMATGKTSAKAGRKRAVSKTGKKRPAKGR
jgi:endonuclease-3